MEVQGLLVRAACGGDVAAVAGLAAELATSFAFDLEQFERNFPVLVGDEKVCLLVATDGGGCVGYLLGFRHLTFFANGPVGWVEEVAVRAGQRGRGTGRALMEAFECWAGEHGCALVALATRRAAPFYRALGYEESAAYFRKVLPGA
ncbi:MAG TPA: GNAT family N-acetyltransferase [Streptosporangiaceae bacterium]